MSQLGEQTSFLIYQKKNTIKFMSTITLCSSHVWLSSHKPQGKKKLLLQVTHFPVAFCCCKIVPCSTSTLPPPPLPILNHYRLCLVGVYFQYMTVVQLRSALKLLQPAHSSAFRCFAFLKQHSSPV